MTQRVMTAVASASFLAVLHSWLLFAWPWRLIGLSLTTSTNLGLSVPAILHSVAAEATLGPALAVLADLGFALRRRTLVGQVHVNADRDRRRARALQPGYRPTRADSSAGTDGHGRIHLGIDQGSASFDLALTDIAQHVLLPGASGSGKTTTIVRITAGALANGYAVAIVDCKAGSLGGEMERLAARENTPFALVHPEENASIGYDVCTGDAADVANKLIGAFPFSGDADIFKQVAMQALPTIVRAQRAAGIAVTLGSICDALSTGGFAQLKRQAPEEFAERLDDLQQSDRDDLAHSGYAGLRYRLRAITEGKFGAVLGKRPALDWDEVSSRPGITYLGLPTTAVAEDVELFGRVIVQDLKQLCSRRLRALGRKEHVQPLLVVFDEFTALRESPQIRDLLLQSRQALMPTVVSQQYLPLDPEIRASVLGSGLLFCHRLNADDAEALANELGTRRIPMLTSQVDFETGEVQKGSVRIVDEYRIHPNKFRELDPGEAVVFARPTQRRAIVRVHRDDL
jgi:hypothetical protein